MKINKKVGKLRKDNFYKLGGSDSLDVKQYITEYLLDPGGRI